MCVCVLEMTDRATEREGGRGEGDVDIYSFSAVSGFQGLRAISVDAQSCESKKNK